MLARIRNALSGLGAGKRSRRPAQVPGTAQIVGQRQQNVTRHDVTSFAAELDLTRLNVLTSAPVWMTRAERLVLFSLIFGLRPARYLEIGTFQGGSALIAANAMDALKSEGRIYCVDPNPRIAPEDWAQLEARAQLFQGYSPQILSQVATAAEGGFDFVLIDGDHTYQGALRDSEGVLPHMSHGSYLLFHDAFHSQVRDAIDEFISMHMDVVTDLGLFTREVTTMTDDQGNQSEWGGLRLIYVH